jgi:hypothetical protein
MTMRLFDRQTIFRGQLARGVGIPPAVNWLSQLVPPQALRSSKRRRRPEVSKSLKIERSFGWNICPAPTRGSGWSAESCVTKIKWAGPTWFQPKPGAPAMRRWPNGIINSEDLAMLAGSGDSPTGWRHCR